MKIKVYRHWDLIITEGNTREDQVELKEDGCMLEGEVTNHHHRISENNAFSVAVLEPTEQTDYYRGTLTITEPAKVTHEEHDTIELTPWKYDTWVQREYDPLENRRVLD